MGQGKYLLRDGEQVDTSFSHLLFYGLPKSRTLRRKTDIRVCLLLTPNRISSPLSFPSTPSHMSSPATVTPVLS